MDKECTHGVTFDSEEAKKLLEGWNPKTSEEWLMGNPMTAEVRKRWPRLNGECPKGCGYKGIFYVSMEHYVAGDW